MEKKKIGPGSYLYPLPTLIVGANVNEKPNYFTIAFCGMVHHNPAMISIGAGKTHYTNIGIRQNQTFSINIPSENMLSLVDYIGLVSGKDKDKSNLFDNFYGKLGTAPMIRECPLNMECKVVDQLDPGDYNDLFIGEIVETYISNEYLTNNLPDIEKIKPIMFSFNDNRYWKLGQKLGDAWTIGKEVAKKIDNK